VPSFLHIHRCHRTRVEFGTMFPTMLASQNQY
jgi:hypothetical protein